MKIYTELMLGKTDPGLREPEDTYDIARAGEHAARIEALGFDGVVATETKDDPFILMALAGQATERLKIATSVAIAFPRAPYVMAMSAWRMQALTRGRFTLGLGSQIKAHIVRRFGMPFSPLGSWMRDYVGAVRAFWDTWQNGTPLDYRSDRYTLNLMVPLFNPGPIEHPDIPIHLAALNTYMCQVVGEVADGLRPHPVCTPRYINEVMKPAVAKGAERAGRDPSGLAVAMKPLVATASDQAGLERKIVDVRARVAFYASTPAYRPAFAIWGLDDLVTELSALSRAQRWEEMPALIDDDVLNTFAVVGIHDEIAGMITERFAGTLSHVGFSIAVEDAKDAERMTAIVREVQQG